MATVLDKIYGCYEKLTSTTGSEQNKKTAYENLLRGIKMQDEKVRRLSCQFAVQFASGFPDRHKDLLNLLLDLIDCEDDGQTAEAMAQMRSQAIQGVAQLCHQFPDLVGKAANLMIQMTLQFADDPTALRVVQRSLNEVIAKDSAQAVSGVLRLVKDDQTDSEMREHACQTLAKTILPTLKAHKDLTAIQTTIYDELSATMNDNSALSDRDYAACIVVMNQLPQMNTLTARQAMVDKLTNKLVTADSKTKFNLKTVDDISKFNNCIDNMMGLLSKNVIARTLFDAAVPHWDNLVKECLSGSKTGEEGAEDNVSLNALQHIAVLSDHVGNVVPIHHQAAATEATNGKATTDNADKYSKQCQALLIQLSNNLYSVVDKLIISAKPVEKPKAAVKEGELKEITTEEEIENINLVGTSTFYSYLECVLVVLYNLSRWWPSVWSELVDSSTDEHKAQWCFVASAHADDDSRTSALRKALQTVALHVQRFKSEATLESRKPLFENLQVVLKEFIRPKAGYRSAVAEGGNPIVFKLSWNPALPATKTVASISQKRKFNQAFNGKKNNKVPRASAEIYRPTGKFAGRGRRNNRW